MCWTDGPGTTADAGASGVDEGDGEPCEGIVRTYAAAAMPSRARPVSSKLPDGLRVALPTGGSANGLPLRASTLQSMQIRAFGGSVLRQTGQVVGPARRSPRSAPSRAGAPHDGQTDANDETVLPHSGHWTNGMASSCVVQPPARSIRAVPENAAVEKGEKLGPIVYLVVEGCRDLLRTATGAPRG